MGKLAQKVQNRYIVAKDAISAQKKLQKVLSRKAPISILLDSEQEARQSIKNWPLQRRMAYGIFKVELR